MRFLRFLLRSPISDFSIKNVTPTPKTWPDEVVQKLHDERKPKEVTNVDKSIVEGHFDSIVIDTFTKLISSLTLRVFATHTAICQSIKKYALVTQGGWVGHEKTSVGC